MRFFYWLLSYFRYSKRVLPLYPFVFLLLFFLYLISTVKDNETISAKILVSCGRRKKAKMQEIILVVIFVPREKYVNNREYSRRCMVNTKTRVDLPRAKSYSRLITYSYSGTDIRSHKSTLPRLIERFIKLSRANTACRTSSFQLLKPRQ